MSKNIKSSLKELIGNTPLYQPKRWLEANEVRNNKIFVKLEYLNATGSVKDRAAMGMIEDLEERGLLHKDSTIIEPTSGNTGISLAALAASRGYKVILTLPESMSIERRKFLAAYGAKLELTPADDGMKGAIRKAQELKESIPNALIPSQFENPANPAYHEKTTGPEIWEQTEGEIDVFVAGVGTGGTISGVARYLKSKNPAIKIIAVEPDTSAVLSGATSGKHGIQGIGAGFVPENYDASLVDTVMQVGSEESIEEGRKFARKEGILVGISSGAALVAVKKLMLQEEYQDKMIVTVLPDSGDRYFSTPMFREE